MVVNTRVGADVSKMRRFGGARRAPSINTRMGFLPSTYLTVSLGLSTMAVLAPTITASTDALKAWSLLKSWGQDRREKPVALAILPSIVAAAAR